MVKEEQPLELEEAKILESVAVVDEPDPPPAATSPYHRRVLLAHLPALFHSSWVAGLSGAGQN